MKKFLLITLALIIMAILPSCDVDPSSEVTGSETVTEEPTTTNTEHITSKKAESESITESETKNNDKEKIAMLPDKVVNYEPLNYDKMKAMWISQFDMKPVYIDNSGQRSESSFINMVSTILDNTVDMGFNTIIVQTRPYADSMYPSNIYPQSYVINGKYGRHMEYDPLEIIISEAHKRKLSVQGWINPMRCMRVSEISLVDDSYKVRQFYNDKTLKGKYIVTVGDRLYLNPAYDEIRKLIVDGATELLSHYEIDGLHMDDYFYPTVEESFDSEAFKKYGNGMSLKDFRRDSLNKLVAELYSSVKLIRPDALFGISPSGVIDKVYDEHCADIYKWCSEDGYIDYICPQLYFGFEHSTCAFDKLFNRWSSIVKDPNIKLFIGMSLGKTVSKFDQYAGEGKYEWEKYNDILSRELTLVKGSDKCCGVAYFCYQYFYDPTTGISEERSEEERKTLIPILKTLWNN